MVIVAASAITLAVAIPPRSEDAICIFPTLIPTFTTTTFTTTTTATATNSSVLSAPLDERIVQAPMGSLVVQPRLHGYGRRHRGPPTRIRREELATHELLLCGVLRCERDELV